MATKKQTTNTKTGSKTKKATLSAFNLKVSPALLSQAIFVYQSNSHQDTSKVKTRGEIRASTRKIYRQKGTGRARHGALSAPIFVGGGIAHGPSGVQPQRKKLTKKVKLKALAGMLSLAQGKNKLTLLTPPSKKTIKTKEALIILPKEKLTKSASLAHHQDSEEFLRAIKNVKNLKLIRASELNAYHVLKTRNLLLTQNALDYLYLKLKPTLEAKKSSPSVKKSNQK